MPQTLYVQSLMVHSLQWSPVFHLTQIPDANIEIFSKSVSFLWSGVSRSSPACKGSAWTLWYI